MLALIAALLAIAPSEMEVTVSAGSAPLHGALLTPEGEPKAAALIIAGSGPTDRNGNAVAMGLNANTYRLLAEGLAAQGVATVRYDKRGVGASAAAGGREEDLRFQTYVEDARAWAVEAARLTGRSCVWLIGHSEGSQIAMAVAETGDAPVCGLVLLSGAGRPVGDVLREQFEAGLPEALKAPALQTLAELEAGRPVAEPPAALAALFRPSIQPYLISWLPLDPAEAIAAWDGPVMIGQGTTDIQTSMTDAQALAAAQPSARLVTWEGVNHVLKTAPADRAANAATYADPALPLAPGVAEDVADFILTPR